jgi:hypothetical protein
MAKFAFNLIASAAQAQISCARQTAQATVGLPISRGETRLPEVFPCFGEKSPRIPDRSKRDEYIAGSRMMCRIMIFSFLVRCSR